MSRTSARRPRVSAAGLALLLLTACSGGGDGGASTGGGAPVAPPRPVAVARVDVAPADVALFPGDTARLVATPRDAADAALAGRAVAWSTSNAGVASVSPSGTITALAVGQATITAESEGQRGGASVRVTPRPTPIARLELSVTRAGVFAGDTLALVATARDSAGTPLPNRIIAWSASTDAARVSAGGVVQAVRAGLVTVTASAEGRTATATLLITIRPRFVQVSAGFAHTCALDAEGVVWCTGANGQGELGRGATSLFEHLPAPAATPLRFARVVAANGFTCALATGDRRVHCWGNTYQGRSLAPQAITGTEGTRDLFNGNGGLANCATGADSVVACWGIRWGTTPSRTALRAEVAAPGDLHLCGLREVNGPVLCQGRGTEGQLGDGRRTSSSTPIVLPGGGVYVAVTPLGWSSCALDREGQAWCWGRALFGGHGDGSDASERLVATRVRQPPGITFAALSGFGATSEHVCALTPTGEAWCWGSGGAGQLGDSAAVNRNVPTQVRTTVRFAQLSAGNGHSCGVSVPSGSGEQRSVAGEVWCWGLGYNGDGTGRSSRVPVRFAIRPPLPPP